MIHSIDILRLPIMALQEYIERELQENPTLSSHEPAAAEQEQADIAGPLNCEPILGANEREIYGRYLPLNYQPAIAVNAETGGLSADDASNAQYVAPDVIVKKHSEGAYEIRVVDDWVPNLSISRRHIDMLKDRHCDEKASEFLRRKIQAAKQLIKAIEQRRSILMRVTRAIMRQQLAFLDKGLEYLKPLQAQEIAEQAEVSGRTVACALENKWIDTPHGAFALQRFFGEGY